MQKSHSFLLRAKSRIWMPAAAYCILALILVLGTGKLPAENKKIPIVYAQGKTTVAAAEETADDVQIPSDKVETADEAIEESVEAMQSDLADAIANQEKERRELEAKRIHLSESDTKILHRIVEAEATGEDIKGKMLVANVILNRVNSDKFPDTVEKVVFANRQFSPIRDGRYYKVTITEETKEAVEKVLAGEDESKGAVYFMSRRQASKKNVSWFDRKLTKVLEYGTHEFFK